MKIFHLFKFDKPEQRRCSVPPVTIVLLAIAGISTGIIAILADSVFCAILAAIMIFCSVDAVLINWCDENQPSKGGDDEI